MAEWGHEQEALPTAGEEHTVIDSAGTPVGTIEITACAVIELGAVDDTVALAEREDYRTAAGWRAEHERFWREEVLPEWDRGTPPVIGDSTPVVVQWFHVTTRL